MSNFELGGDDQQINANGVSPRLASQLAELRDKHARAKAARELIEEQAAEAKSWEVYKIKRSDHVLKAAAKMLDLYAYCATQKNCVLPIFPMSIDDGMTIPAFRTLYAANADEEIGPRGGRSILNPVDLWIKHPTRKDVSGIRARPDKPHPLFEDDGQLWINAFSMPIHDALPEGRSTFERFLTHLLPNRAEREWFLDWLAHKFRNPEVPGAGVIMVSKHQGAGRGTLFQILRQLFGARNTRKVDGVTLTGEGGQSQYNTWLANSIVLFIDELFNSGTGAHLWQRKKAYDRLKGLIDPASRDVEIIQKTLNNYVAPTFASFLMATNNSNALPLDQDDRRICVLTNRDKLVDAPSLTAELGIYRRGSQFSDGFVAGVALLLSERRLDAFDPYAPPPLFAGKITMILQNTTEVAEAADEAIEEMPGDFVTRNAFVERVKIKLGDASHDQKNLVPEARDRIDRSNWIFLGRVVIRQGGSKADVWARNQDAATRWWNTPLAERQQLLEENNNPRAQFATAVAKRLSLVSGNS